MGDAVNSDLDPLTDELGPIRQIAYVVSDLDKAVETWLEQLNVGPFFVIRRARLSHFQCGESTVAPQLSVAISSSGGVQIELIEQINDAPSAFQVPTRQPGQGAHHISYWTSDYDRATERLLRAGGVVVQSGRSVSGAADERFAYVTVGSGAAALVEVTEMSAAKFDRQREMAHAAADWDGRDPIRDLVIPTAGS